MFTKRLAAEHTAAKLKLPHVLNVSQPPDTSLRRSAAWL
jgi:hypothetical protein